MLRLFARWYPKRKYVFSQFVEAATNDLNAGLSLRLASEKRALIEELNNEADDIEANIKAVDEKLTKGYWECENGHEVQLIKSKSPVPTDSCPECSKSLKLIKRDEMIGQEKYESDKERGEAEKIAAEKRVQAKAEEENLANSEKTPNTSRALRRTAGAWPRK